MQRLNIPGTYHFVTSRTARKQPFFTDDKCCELFLANLDHYRQQLDFKIPAYVIMPDHIHLLIYFDMERYPNLTISTIMHRIKGYSSRLIYEYITGRQGSYALPEVSQGAVALAAQRANNKKEKGLISKVRYRIWQPGFYDFNVYSDRKLAEKINYIHNNPLKAVLVKDIVEYKYSSWRNYHLEDHSIFKVDIIEY